MSEVQRGTRGAKARPLRGSVHKGADARLPAHRHSHSMAKPGNAADVPLWTETRFVSIVQTFPRKAVIEIVTPARLISNAKLWPPMRFVQSTSEAAYLNVGARTR